MVFYSVEVSYENRKHSMALYMYQAFSKDGKRVAGTVDVASLKHAHEYLSSKGLFPIKIVIATEGASTGFSFKSLFERPVTLKDKLFFTKQLQVLLKSGVPLLDALDLMTQQTEGRLKTIIVSLRDGIKEGKSLAEGLAAYPKTFETIYIQLVRAGEASGKLDFILERLTNYYQRRDDLRRRIRGALMFPIIQLCMIAAVTVLLLIYVVPKIASVFKTQKQELPFATQLLMTVSDFLTSYYLVIIIGMAALYAAYRLWRATPNGARAIDALKLRIPIVKHFVRLGAVVQFSSTLGMLLEGGVGIAESLDIVCNIVDNKVLTSALQDAREKIIKQGHVAQYLKETNIFPPVAIYLINTGEQSGQLSQMLDQVADNYELELRELSDSLTARLNPIMIIVMAVIIGFIMIAILVPISQLGQNVESRVSKTQRNVS